MGEQGGNAKSWTSRSIGSRFQHSFFYLLIRLGGRPAAYGFLKLVVFWYATFRPSVRARSKPYLSRRFPGAGPLSHWWNTYRLFLGIGQALIDRAATGIIGPEALKAELERHDDLLKLVGEGRGVIVVTAHVGCWQAAMSALEYLDTPVHMLMQREDGDVDRHYYEHRGVPCPYRIIDPRGFLGGAVEMTDVLRRGEVLCVMGDRVLGEDRNTVRVNFLGDPAPFPVAAYKLSAATGAPVALLFSAKTGSGSYRLILADVFQVERSPGRGAAIYLPQAQRFVDALEKYAREYPFQFFNFFDMWKSG